ncbi:MAG: multidrug DMT transporter permease [Candidatus Latescibacteria bacterium]|jgi:drug/metabolite transporter (DMT)-like permease|nr:multidrug DMT transporter permease [Candidatus Latescibacterota bacterium]MBT4136770.1 multidrug DMT transporter permease [Candidatus Latescibacterota bacterium]MBT5829731.1 multidrug DMT transporter permease [Candidatus Latescibacterota bacterium]
MSSIAIILILISAIAHASWNLLGKSQKPNKAFFLLANIFGTLFLGIIASSSSNLIPQIPPQVWYLLIATGLCQTLYFTGLSNGYRHGDLSIIYPVVRGLPALMVVSISLLLGRSDQISTQSILGCVFIFSGCLILPMKRFQDFRVDNYRNLSSFFALLAALGTVGYSFIDDLALREMREIPNTGLAIWQITIVYAFFEGIFTTLWMAITGLPYQTIRTDLLLLFKTTWSRAALTGLIISFTYVLVLISLAFVSDVSYVVGFRQLSIPIGALMGIFLLKESAHKPRLVGVGILFIGLVLIATG